MCADHVDEVVDTIYQYVAMLREAGPQEYVWQELRTMSELQFRFKEKGSATDLSSRIASSLCVRFIESCRCLYVACRQLYPPELVLSGTSCSVIASEVCSPTAFACSGGSVYYDFDPAGIQEMLDTFVPANMIMQHVSPSLAGAPLPWTEEQYYGVRYAVTPIDDALLTVRAACFLCLPFLLSILEIC